MKPKKLTKQTVTGQQGINLIEKMVLGMGSIWNPQAAIDVGIDGNIELCEPGTGRALGVILLVQSRATEQEFQAESATTFDYLCSERELAYWLQGNAPVILIVSRPSKGEAYWVSLKEYFADPARRASRRVRFDKQSDRFSEASFKALVDIASYPGAGLYLGPPAKSESLVSNLLQVVSYAPRIYLAATELRNADEVFRLRNERGISLPAGWLVKSKQFLSIHDLRERPWSELCDQGSIEDFGVEEWANSDDEDRRRDFVRLLNQCLKEKLYPRVIHHKELDCYMFRPYQDKKPYSIDYPGLNRTAKRKVFVAFENRKTGLISHYRHDAFEAAFRRLEGNWYLEINPTYVFTIDGERLSYFQSDQLSKIKRYERNPDVRRQVLMWAHLLGRGEDLVTPPYPFLVFGDLARFEMPVGIDDNAWAPEPPKPQRLVDSLQVELEPA